VGQLGRLVVNRDDRSFSR